MSVVSAMPIPTQVKVRGVNFITIAYALLFSPKACLGSADKVFHELTRVGKVVWSCELIGRIPPLAWSESILPFAIGIVMNFVLWRVLPLQKLLSFVQIFEHEVVHGLTAIACGGSFRILVVSSQGGMAEVTKSNIFVRLAPYCIPLLCTTALLLVNMLSPDKKVYGFILAGTLYGNFARGSFSNLGIQPDIKISGKWLSYPLIFFANIAAAILLGFLLIEMGS